MSDYKQDVELGFKAYVDNDFEIDENGHCSIVTMIYLGDEDDATEVHAELEAVVDGLLEYLDTIGSYQKLYALAHEFSRQAERLRVVAGRIEDSDSAIRDLFDV